MADERTVDAAWPVLNDQQLSELRPVGTERAVEVGEVLYCAGDAEYDFYVVLEGEIEIVRPGPEGDVVLARHSARNFLGELNMLTGQRAYVTARAAQPGRA